MLTPSGHYKVEFTGSVCGPPVTVIYDLTERGQALIPAPDLIAAWARDTFRPAIADSNARPPLAFDTVRTH